MQISARGPELLVAEVADGDVMVPFNEDLYHSLLTGDLYDSMKRDEFNCGLMRMPKIGGYIKSAEDARALRLAAFNADRRSYIICSLGYKYDPNYAVAIPQATEEKALLDGGFRLLAETLNIKENHPIKLLGAVTIQSPWPKKPPFGRLADKIKMDATIRERGGNPRLCVMPTCRECYPNG